MIRAYLRPLAAIVLLAVTGCSSKTTSPTGTGDISGLRLGAFASDRGNTSGQYDIYLWDYDASALKPIDAIRSTSAETHPTITSDGRFIAFEVNRGSSGFDIEMFDRKGPGFIDLSGLNTASNESEPAFSGDGKLLCYTQGIGTNRRVRLFDGVNGVTVPLPGLDTTGVTYADYSPSPNRDATLIAFVSTRNSGVPHIFIFDRNLHKVLRGPSLVNALEQGANQDIDPSWSQSGYFLAFASDRAGGAGGLDVYALEFVRTTSTVDTVLRVVPAANSPDTERHPSISDTGNMLVFQSDRTLGSVGRFDLYNFDRQTSALTHPVPPLLYNSAGDDIEPSLKWPY